MTAITSGRECRLLIFGCISYSEAWQVQQKIAAARRSGSCQDTLLLVEHSPVYTIGRTGSKANVKISDQELMDKGLEVIEVDRGGDVTYHGPGQLVGYPILDLKGYKQDLHYYTELLEEVIIRTLAEYQIRGFREAGLTGVWTDKGKIAAIGIGARGWITMHGFSLNVKPDMSYFALINPCGITDRPVVSMRELGISAGIWEVGQKLSKQFAAVFGVKLLYCSDDFSTGAPKRRHGGCYQ